MTKSSSRKGICFQSFADVARSAKVSQKFRTTNWSLVLEAAQKDTPQGREALARLCEAYWYPLYVFIRRKGYDVDEARDLTQAFFVRLLEKNYLKEVKPEASRFRSFLLTSLKHFLANEWDRPTL
jgi:RNA polymerase sigma-70 factor (ECF subfamily)